ncbi:WD domain, G-beta repeat protein [Teladorsagia circumcincta]|uniref:WD domain, G-beta repeat protein n=1 Tax=Teladorsagia circumcincta TaxID=45464 RepID=A0A2G9U2N3_TELCI|nr:WD domain, G-beta repeat protein [Teladorsagia circumcincta]
MFEVPLDFLGLEVPIACTDARYVDDSGTIIEATKVHELRLYDPRAQRRPVKKIPFMDVPITAVSRCYRDNHVLAANTIGEMGLFDLRSKVHPVCKYKGQAGAIRSIDAHPTAPYVATCGIDRFVRVHDIDTKKLAHKIYCKTRLNRVLIRSEMPSLTTVVEGNDEEWMELKKEMNCESDSASASGSDDDESVDECTWEKMGVNDDDDDPMSSGTLRKRHEEVVEGQSESCEDDEPASKKRRVTKSKKRKEEPQVEGESVEPRKKAKIVKGVKRHDEIKEEVGGFRRRAPKAQKDSEAGSMRFLSIRKSLLSWLVLKCPSSREVWLSVMNGHW